VYELVFVKTDKCTHVNQSVFYIFPEAKEYATSDLFRKHPTVPDHWLYQGRADNIIVFSNGEKLNPVSIEEEVGRSKFLKSALVVGQARFQPALILDPITHPKTEAEARRLINDVWPLVVKMNKETGMTSCPLINCTADPSSRPRTTPEKLDRSVKPG
jgi:hypothetical protein